MSKHANPTAIGAFVIGAIALLVSTLILLGAGKIFSDPSRYVAYFDGSIQGLRKGANVNFRGVRIGQVREVHVRFDESTKKFDLPVVLEIDPESIQLIGEIKTDPKTSIPTLIQRGLRAKLQVESFVTGQLLVDLDLYPDEEKIELKGGSSKYQEIPTIPSDIQLVLDNVQQFMKKLKDLPVEDIMANLTSTIKGIDKLVNNPELASILEGTNKLINSKDTQKISAKLQITMSNLDAAASEIKLLAKTTNKNLTPVINDTGITINEVRTTVINMQETLKGIREDFNDETSRHEISTTLNELRNAARSFRIFVEYLETHPEAFLKGKHDPQ